MADVLKVDADALWGLAADITSVSADLEATNDLLSKYCDAVGSGDVRDALSGFESHWSRGRRLIAEKAASLGSMLAESADTYVETDTSMAGALTQQKTSTRAGGQVR